MSTITYSHGAAVAGTEANSRAGQRKSFWRRVYDGIIAGRQRRAEREIAAYVASHGGLFTDDMEREIMQRLSGGPRRSV
jgi:hypothetical protein